MGARYTTEQASKLQIVDNNTRKTLKQVAETVKLEEIQRGLKKRAKSAVLDNLSSSGIRIDLKPLSVNEAFQGRRFKSPAYNVYTQSMMALLPKFSVGGAPYKISYEFGFSSRGADLANPEKCTTDILCKFYGFDDRDIFEMNLKKVIVKKGSEYISFRIESI